MHEVECALRADGSSPAGEFFDGLKAGGLHGDPDSEVPPPDPDQIEDYAWFLDEIGNFAREGETNRRSAVNYLRDGIWEFKHGSKRLTFYDTNGAGGYTPKSKIINAADSPYPDSPWWDVPDLEFSIRLGHWFYKDGEKTSEEDLALAALVREEDLAHDRP